MSTDHNIEQLQSYVGLLVDSGHCTAAAILDLQGNVLASSEGFTAPEAKAIAANLDDATALRLNGCTLNNIRYSCIHAEPGIFVGRQSVNGLCIAKSGSYIVIGGHGEGLNGANCRHTVEQMKDYLVGINQ